MTEEEQAQLEEILHNAGIATMDIPLDWVDDTPVKGEG